MLESSHVLIIRGVRSALNKAHNSYASTFKKVDVYFLLQWLWSLPVLYVSQRCWHIACPWIDPPSGRSCNIFKPAHLRAWVGCVHLVQHVITSTENWRQFCPSSLSHMFLVVTHFLKVHISMSLFHKCVDVQ